MKKSVIMFIRILLFTLLCCVPVRAESSGWSKACNAYSKFLAENVSEFKVQPFVWDHKNNESIEKTNRFLIVDLDNNGVPELITEHDYGYKQIYLLVYTFKNNKVERIKNSDGTPMLRFFSNTAAGNSCIYACSKKHLHTANVSGMRTEETVNVLKNGTFFQYLLYNEIEYGKYSSAKMNGKEISASKYKSIVNKCSIGVRKYCVNNTKANRQKILGSTGTTSNIKNSLVLNKKSAVIYVSGTNSIQLKATVKSGTGKVIWESDNPLVAKVNANGKVTAVKTGKTVITAKCGKISAKCNITVKQSETETAFRKFMINQNMKGYYYSIEKIGPNRCPILMIVKHFTGTDDTMKTYKPKDAGYSAELYYYKNKKVYRIGYASSRISWGPLFVYKNNLCSYTHKFYEGYRKLVVNFGDIKDYQYKSVPADMKLKSKYITFKKITY